MLPDSITEREYWENLYKQPVDHWRNMLETIRERHQLPAATWGRFAFGKNAVFGFGDLVVKVSPPFWREDLWNEAEVLEFVANRLPVATPELVASGEIGAWGYAVTSRIRGELLRDHWKTFTPEERVKLAYQHGEIMAGLHALLVEGHLPRLQGDWNTPMLQAQRQACYMEMQKAGVPDVLLADLETYLDGAQPLLDADTEWVLIHGDLDAVNMQVENGEITGLFDWGDVRLGPVTHEFISPCVHSYRGERAALRAWVEGYGLKPTPEFEHNVMARTMLYYADEFAHHLKHVPGASACQSWEEVAHYFWHMR